MFGSRLDNNFIFQIEFYFFFRSAYNRPGEKNAIKLMMKRGKLDVIFLFFNFLGNDNRKSMIINEDALEKRKLVEEW